MPDEYGFFRYVAEPERNKDGQVTPDGFVTHPSASLPNRNSASRLATVLSMCNEEESYESL